ncbi:MAG: DUF4876 domain-containing protein [Bacteroidales bacterium]|nr:DUF4876 domain-containing protein [Bacteroidales bacterium]MBE6246843.1 DUF4876 domain-containing protein [Bacteroidales bacterium]
MKKIFLFMMAALATVACEQFEDVKSVDRIGEISVGIQISLDKGDDVPSPASYKVKLNNYAENIEMVQEVKAGDVVELKDIIPGIYTIAVSGESSANGFTYVFNGNLSNVNVTENGKKFSLEMTAAKSGNIIFKEVYYCGSKIGGKTSYFRDQYYELYNNSNQVQYLDGLCIGNINPAGTSSIKYVWNRENQEDYIYFQTIWQIPFDRENPDNKLYPLQPGESVILAQMAHDHRAANLNPDCPVDLSGAEFEFYLKTTAYTKDNPAHNMIGAFWKLTTSWWLVTVNGGAFAIFYPDEQMASVMYEPDYEKIYSGSWVTPVGYSTKGKDVPIDCIVDAVELMLNESKITQKRMPAVLDAGATWVGGTYKAMSVSRKIKETREDGTVVYVDTNNSLEDFQVNDKPVPRREGAKIPSWNTWAN